MYVYLCNYVQIFDIPMLVSMSMHVDQPSAVAAQVGTVDRRQCRQSLYIWVLVCIGKLPTNVLRIRYEYTCWQIDTYSLILVYWSAVRGHFWPGTLHWYSILSSLLKNSFAAAKACQRRATFGLVIGSYSLHEAFWFCKAASQYESPRTKVVSPPLCNRSTVLVPWLS